MKFFIIFILALFIISTTCEFSLYASNLPGKDLFYNSKGRYGSCNHCHRNGASAGRWNFETQSIDQEEGRKIPSLKGVGKRKDQDQIQRSIQMMRKMFDFKLTDEQISQLAEYLGTL